MGLCPPNLGQEQGGQHDGQRFQGPFCEPWVKPMFENKKVQIPGGWFSLQNWPVETLYEWLYFLWQTGINI